MVRFSSRTAAADRREITCPRSEPTVGFMAGKEIDF